LAEKEELLRSVTFEKSRLEIEAEGFHQRLRSLDESEHRYKDENWNLETQIHEHIATAKESADREKKLTQSLNLLQAEKSAAQKELDEIKLSHAKLADDHAATIKHHDVELGSAKRSMTMIENERGALQRKIEELTGQNQELAMAFAQQRGRTDQQQQAKGFSDEDFESAADNVTPEHSPPPSPTKGTPRHSMLETETLKSSLHHAHRMIQNLKGNIHREKTEKLELKRMLQDARDELEIKRGESGLPGSANGRKSRKIDSKEFKKPLKPGQLGGLRASRSEVFVEEANWEDHTGEPSPTHSPATRHLDSSDHFETANETSDAFETANERGTETEDFHTGAEDLSGSDELTETEGASVSANPRGKKPADLALSKIGNRNSFQSTASLSGDEYSYEEVKTPVQTQPQRMRLRVNRSGFRRSRVPSEEPTLASSPASFANSSNNGTPQATGQSLFAELEDLGGSDDDESIDGTPSRSSIASPVVASVPGSTFEIPDSATASAFVDTPTTSCPVMVDTGIMTDEWEPTPPTPQTAIPYIVGASLAGTGLLAAAHMLPDDHISSAQPAISDAASQWHDNQPDNLPSASREDERPISTSTYSDRSSQYDPDIDAKLAEFPSPPSSPSHTPMPSVVGPTSPVATPLSISTILSEHVEPVAAPEPPSPLTKEVRPVTPIPVDMPASLGLSSILSEHVEPVAVPEPPSPLTKEVRPVTPIPVYVPASLGLSSILSEHVEPVAVPEPPSPLMKEVRPVTPIHVDVPASLGLSSIQTVVATEPIAPLPPRSPRRDTIIIPTDDISKDLTPDEAKQGDPETPKPAFIGSVFSWNKNKAPSTPVIAEDETRQSPRDSPAIETPESQRPFKEVSGNTSERVIKKPKVEMTDESSQTALTAEQIDNMLMERSKRQEAIIVENATPASPTPSVIISPSLRVRKSQESVGSVGRARAKMADPDSVHDTIMLKRPGSAGSNRGSISSSHPPLPLDHKQVIAAAAQRVGSSSGGAGSMGPPLLPASAYRANPTFRPRTPSQTAISTNTARGGTTPRPMHSSGTAEVYSPTGAASRSRQSSVSSFVSEIDSRFNSGRGGLSMPQGIEPGTDPRMIQAITQTMIGEYLWKYTRKAGRGEMSENRHRRYFWVHPYTRTLYWSDRDPAQAGRAELKAKSVAIEAVRVVTDDNPMPPGLHRKSLVILTPGRAVKFTATTGQRHETWFNALSYLLLRTDDGASLGDTESIANGALTREDVEEFNPGYGARSVRPSPSSLSSYNSRTTRNESPARKSPMMSFNQPTLVQNSAASRPSLGSFSRLSSYWKPSKDGKVGSFSSRKSRNSLGGAGSIYEASEVHDSAEDLREMIEKQDRESDRLENVRACCDGKRLFYHSS